MFLRCSCGDYRPFYSLAFIAFTLLFFMGSVYSVYSALFMGVNFVNSENLFYKVPIIPDINRMIQIRLSML